MENKVLRSCLLAVVIIALLGVTFFSGFAAGVLLPNNAIRQALGLEDKPLLQAPSFLLSSQGNQPKKSKPLLRYSRLRPMKNWKSFSSHFGRVGICCMKTMLINHWTIWH